MSLHEDGASPEDCATDPDPGLSASHSADQLMTEILSSLSDGLIHKIDALCDTCNVSSQQLDNFLVRIESIGLQIIKPEPGRLQWVNPVALLSQSAVVTHLGNMAQRLTFKMEFPFTCGSTNTVARNLLAQHPHEKIVVATEFQTSGRGTRGRHWQSRAASGLCFSMAMEWHQPKRLDSSLALSVGIAVANGLCELSDAPVLLKWPNDLIVRDAKLGGILVETSTTANNTVRIVIGVGINVSHNPASLHQIDTMSLPAASLTEHCTTVPERNALLADLLFRIFAVCESYRLDSKSSLTEAYTPFDYLKFRSVQVTQENTVRVGTAQGINEDGALLVEIDGQQHTLFSGDVRVRKI